MIARQLLISLMALAILPVSQEQVVVRPLQPVSPSPVWLLRVAPLSDDVSQLSVFYHSEEAAIVPAFIEVTLMGKHGNADPKRLPKQAIQTWLLRGDGTSVAQMPKSFHGFPLSEATTDFYPDAVSFDFVTVPPKELAGVVVSVNGTLLVREIKAS
jgi:hypothetical protein